MTKTEARKIAIAINAWRRGETGDLFMPATPERFGIAIDILTQPSTIAENIRNAAINWPEFLGDVESQIIYAFVLDMENPWGTADCEWITFLLFVAEAIES